MKLPPIFSLRRRLLWLLLPAACILLFFARTFPAFAEWYATGPYRLLSHWGNFLSSSFPGSIGEWLVVAGIPAALGFLIFLPVRQWRRGGDRRRALGSFFGGLLSIGSIVLFLFTVTCGINYSRYPFAQTCGLTIQPSTREELQGLCQSLAADVNDLRVQVETDSDGVMRLSGKWDETTRQARAAMRAASADYPLVDGTYLGPKPVLFSRALSMCEITGVFFPFTFEANVNTDVPDYSIPSTMCHELAHLSGFMREDEANFIAALACERSDSIDFRYSGKMLAYIYVSNALYAEDAQAAREISASLNEGVRKDLDANNAYWKQFQSPVAEVADRVNNAYLKANQQEDGVKSYGRVVDLLLAEYRQS